jgi:hypothetical protein
LKVAFYLLVIPSVAGSLVVFAARHTFDADAERVLDEARKDVARA